ncbi:serine hydrolase domain-containing protein [Psychrobacter pygoscelis]|uniref:serine hydrolase domain-containing protein n=1 Tax=Psychrobacter pygoscelis TaxID=2488563 RepID=UPI00103F602F|nr:serine hydrolase domain-containing protein [Psychrobacter pygoscelis]
MNNSNNLSESLQSLLNHMQLEGAPAGGAVVVFKEGECVAELSTGLAQSATPWTADTLSLNFSTGKGVLATLVHVLVSAGLLEYDKPIAHYWPEFAANGKQEVTLRAVMSHQAGLYDCRSLTAQGLSMLDWQAMLAQVAAMPIAPPVPLSSAARRQYNQIQQPAQEQGSDQASGKPTSYQSVYSALVYGWIIGGLIETVTKVSLAQVLRQYLTEPLGIENACYFGVPEAQLSQVARLAKDFEGQSNNQTEAKDKGVSEDKYSEAGSGQNTNQDTSQNNQAFYQQLAIYDCWLQRADTLGIKYKDKLNSDKINRLYFDTRLMELNAYKSALSSPGKDPIDYHSVETLQACIPAANGVASAKALATIYAMLANGGKWQGRTLIDAATFAELSKIHVTGMDAVIPALASAQSKNNGAAANKLASMNWRLGYHRIPSACHKAANVFGHMGYNGSVAWCDPSRNLAVAYVHNFDTTMFTDIRQFIISETVLAL